MANSLKSVNQAKRGTPTTSQGSIVPSTNNGMIASIPAASMLTTRVDNPGIQKLNGRNWLTWKWQILNILAVKGLSHVVDDANVLENSEQELTARYIVSSSLDEKVINKVVHCSNVQQIWTTLRCIYENTTGYAITALINKLNSFSIKSLDEVESTVSEIRSIGAQILSMGGTIDTTHLENAILTALPDSFENFISAWIFLPAEVRTCEELQSRLMQHVNRLRTRDTRMNKALFGKAKTYPKDSKKKEDHSNTTINKSESSSINPV